MERSAAKPRGPKPFEACAAGQTASLLLCLRGWNSGWGDLTLRHAPASATAALGWTAVKAAPSKDHLRGSSNTSLIALLVLMSVIRCILVVVAQTDLCTASLQGSSALGRCGPYPPLRAEMQSTIKAKGQ